MDIQTGQIITDGTAVWIIDDVRDGNRVGDIILRHTLRQGYVKANGAVLAAEDYPRLLKYAQDNSLTVPEAEWRAGKQGMYVYDETAGTLRVPDLRGEFLRGLDDGRGIDTNRVLGTTQGDAMQTHITQISFERMADTGYGCGAVAGNVTARNSGQPNTGVQIGGHSPQIIQYALNYRSAAETRPHNIALIAQIKY